MMEQATQPFTNRLLRQARAMAASALLAIGLLAAHTPAGAAVGTAVIDAIWQQGPVTVFYPTDAAPGRLQRGPFTFNMASNAPPVRGNGRLVVISHGSGGNPWVHADLASALVEAGYIVAMPRHHADNSVDPSNPGPDSWALRPQEVSHAIDMVSADPRLGPLFDPRQVGLYGMSAGGHTALTLAGGRWSPKRFAQHCDDHLAQDFQTCVGLITQLGGRFDGLRLWLARRVIDWKFTDAGWHQSVDPRIRAIVAAVPLAADFDMDSLARPKVPLALVTAGKDQWLVPEFHGERVLRACQSCERLANLADGGHGALLSPLPPGLSGLVGRLLNDPPGFDRGQLPQVDQRIVGYFDRHLLAGRNPSVSRPSSANGTPAQTR